VNAVPPIRRQILVEADPAVAFEVFTAGLGRWWPVAELSVHGEGGSVSFDGAFAGGQIVERSAAGETAVWGTVTRWEPPDAVAFTWHPGQPAEQASQVEITFAAAEPAGDGTARTLVAVVHTGWEAFADPAAARAEYDHGWPLVLGRYAGHIAGRDADAGDGDGEGGEDAGDDSGGEDAGGGEDTWVALLHRPGPGAPRDGSVFTDPRFGEHVAFLSRMHAAGYLVAAGPLADADGEGMTILRLPGPGRLGDATRLATEDDISVASGFFGVTVRPWRVVMRGA
jgi:uncharacterized protein YciI/uncharacterized protein YndB with AHSA1/START domain